LTEAGAPGPGGEDVGDRNVVPSFADAAESVDFSAATAVKGLDV
jgi:hypothetical protein